jgi:hypothetical protein
VDQGKKRGKERKREAGRKNGKRKHGRQDLSGELWSKMEKVAA